MSKEDSETTAIVVTSPTSELTHEEYAKLLKETYETADVFRKGALESYWRLGGPVLQLVGQDRAQSYGKKLIEKLAADLYEKYGLQLGVKALYHAGRLRKSLSREQLDLALAGNLSLEPALELCTQKVTEQVRQDVLEQSKSAAESGTPFSVRDALTGDNTTDNTGQGGVQGAGGAQGRSLPKKPLKGVAHMAKFFSMVENKIDMVGECVEAVCKGDSEEDIKKARAAFEDACVSFNNMADMWKAQYAQSVKALDTVRDIR